MSHTLIQICASTLGGQQRCELTVRVDMRASVWPPLELPPERIREGHGQREDFLAHSKRRTTLARDYPQAVVTLVKMPLQDLRRQRALV